MSLRKDTVLAEIERLYADRFGSFLRVARAITRDRERALEAVQDGFADAIRSRETFRGEGPLEAWVWRAVVNAAHKAARATGAELRAEAAETNIFAPSPSEVAPLVSALPQRQRLAVFLRYYADLDYRAIARVLGVEVGTVSATLAAAHTALRRAFEEVRADA